MRGSGGFSGTSNATPVVAGIYARALFEARRMLRGPGRVQHKGVIARGAAIGCGGARPRCELGDGILTGDYVFVKKQLDARNGEIVVAMIDDEATVKRVYFEGDRGQRARDDQPPETRGRQVARGERSVAVGVRL